MTAAEPGKRKRNAWRFGRMAEALCVWQLRLKGYRILARGFSVPVGEIDIIARRGGTLVLVEVKARRDLATAAQSLGRRQQDRIARAATAFLKVRPGCDGLDMRFDVMLVRPWRPAVHLTDAWRPGSSG